MSSNNSVNLPVRPVTGLAGSLPWRTPVARQQGARPSRAAGWRRRWADMYVGHHRMRLDYIVSVFLLSSAGSVFGCSHHNANAEASAPSEHAGCATGHPTQVVVGPAELLSRLRDAAVRSSNSPFFKSGQFHDELLAYVGRVNSAGGKFFDLVVLETTWGAACRMTRRLLIFDSEGTYLGNYGSLDERPTAVQGSVVAFPFPVEEGNELDLSHGIPTGEVLLGGQLHGFDATNR